MCFSVTFERFMAIPKISQPHKSGTEAVPVLGPRHLRTAKSRPATRKAAFTSGLLRAALVCHDAGFVKTGDATWQAEL